MITNILRNSPSISLESTCVTATVPNCPGHPATAPVTSKTLLELLTAQATSGEVTTAVTLTQASWEGTRNLEHISKRETSTEQKEEHLRCDLSLISDAALCNEAYSKTCGRTAIVQQLHRRSQSGITDKRQERSRLLTPRQNPAPVRRSVTLVMKHPFIIRVTKNNAFPSVTALRLPSPPAPLQPAPAATLPPHRHPLAADPSPGTGPYQTNPFRPKRR